MAPQDDLTAERAALLVHQRLVLAPTREAKEDNLKVIAASLKTARQEALREAREAVLAEMLEDPPDNIGDEGYNTAIRHAADALDRLASEGG